MRVFLAACVAATTVLLATSGCSSAQLPSFMPTFGSKAKRSKPNPSALTNAPPAPQLSSMGGGPSGASASGNLPVYPGTNYPQTPYPDHALASSGATPPYSGYSQSAPSSYGTMPPSVSTGSATPYSPYADAAGASNYAGQSAAQQAPGYSPSPYTSGQNPGYSEQPPPAYGQQPPPSYAQQSAPPYAGGQAGPYAAGSSPYASQQDPSSQPHNAANPYGTYQR